MEFTRRHILAASGASIGFAGCLGDDDTDDTANDPGSDDTGEDDGTGAMNSTVQVSSHAELGDVLVDSEGMTLYMFESDTQGEGASTCYDDCADTWPPLTADDEPTAGDGVTAELDGFERETGERQVRANGWPLYYFASDEEPGEAGGQGASDVWWVLRPDGSPVTSVEEGSDNGPY
ncbi:MAG: hypothetical protein V5A55_05015 [Halovenus sp.]